MMSDDIQAKSQVRERPILFSGPMVNAILGGRKTQTRRIVKPQPVIESDQRMHWKGIGWTKHHSRIISDMVRDCPYGGVGERLWVRETWCRWGAGAAFVGYRATDEDRICADSIHEGWRPSIFLRRDEARLFLEITDVRVRRLQEISAEDAYREGVTDSWPKSGMPYLSGFGGRAVVNNFAHLWDSINGERKGASFLANPWVWVISFRLIDPIPNKWSLPIDKVVAKC